MQNVTSAAEGHVTGLNMTSPVDTDLGEITGVAFTRSSGSVSVGGGAERGMGVEGGGGVRG